MSVRFERFELRAFGPFTGCVIDLIGASDGSLHIVCGRNEAGKSTARRGFGDFLFGIPSRSTDNQLHDYAEMRLAATVVGDDGSRAFVRRKGNRATLRSPGGEPVDEGLLEAMLGGISREAFESMFSITHESLVVGGKALLAADGELGESLFSASLGASKLHELRAALDGDADALFRPRATTSLVHQSRSKLETAQAQLREATLRATTFTENQRLLRTAKEDRAALADQLGDARAAQNARRRVRAVMPLLAALRSHREELAGLGEAPELPQDAPERRVRAIERAADARRGADDARGRVEDLTQGIADLGPDPNLLKREHSIRDLHGRVANVREGVADLHRQTVKLETTRGLARRALHQVRPDMDLEAAHELRLTRARRGEIAQALERHAELSALVAEARTAADEADQRARELADELDALDAIPDTAGLEAAVSAALEEGHVEQRLISAEGELVNAKTALESAIRHLEPATDPGQLRAMRPPSGRAVEAFVEERESLDERGRQLVAEGERISTARREVEEADARFELQTSVPTAEDLNAARCERDDEWKRLRAKFEGAGGGTPSPDAFEGRLRRADDIADRLRDEAETVTRRLDLTVRGQRLDADEEYLDRRRGELAAEYQDHERRWLDAWEPTGLEPRSPREMADWLSLRQAALERADAVDARARAVEAEERSRDRHIEAVQARLDALGEQRPRDTTLRELLALAQARVERAKTVRARHDKLARDLDTAQKTASRQSRKAEEHERTLAGWTEDWTLTVSDCRWSAGLLPAAGRDMLDAIDELDRQLHEAGQLDSRVRGIQERVATFESDSKEIVDAVAPELASWPAQDAVGELAKRLDAALDVRSRRETLVGQLAAAREELAAATREEERADEELAELVALAGAEGTDELPDTERRSARARELKAEIPRLERQVAEVGEAPLDELAAAVEGVDLDALDAEICAGDEDLGRLEEELQGMDVRLGQLGAEHDEMERSHGAAEAAEAVERRVAELRELTKTYLRLYVAAWALSQAIDAYRREHKAPLLARADQLFPQLTCGRFGGLEVSFDANDDPVLVGVRPDGERVGVGLMSTGTREQLYLALRLASLERHVELHGPMPVILDDVVLHSDPNRKTAILRALAELGQRTQVVAFTHDPQVVALAQDAIDPALLTVHELGGTEISGAPQRQIHVADVRSVPVSRAA